MSEDRIFDCGAEGGGWRKSLSTLPDLRLSRHVRFGDACLGDGMTASRRADKLLRHPPSQAAALVMLRASSPQDVGRNRLGPFHKPLPAEFW